MVVLMIQPQRLRVMPDDLLEGPVTELVVVPPDVGPCYRVGNGFHTPQIALCEQRKP